MIAFIARRLLLAVGVLVTVSFGTFIFITTRFDSTCWGHPRGTAKAIALYWGWLKGVPNGHSFAQQCSEPEGPTLWQAFGHTAALLGAAAVLVLVLSFLLGTLAAARSGTALDTILRAFSYTAWAVPAFLLGLALQSVLNWAGNRYGVRPFELQGWPGICATPFGPTSLHCPGPHGLHYVGSVLRHIAVPATALAVAFVGVHSRYLRSSLLVALHAPYTVTARAKGLPERGVLRHALRNSLAAFTSALLLDFGAIFGAAMAVDWVFRLNGLGTLFITDVAGVGGADGPRFLDPYGIQELLTLAAILVVASSVLAELAVLWLDPRARSA